MNLINSIATGFSFITRNISNSKKAKKISKHFNWLFLTMGANPIVVAKMQDGTQVKVNLTTRTERMAFYSGVYDEDLLGVVKKLLTPDSIVLDIGANIGFYSVAISNLFKSQNGNGKVISFEPFDGNFERLKFNINQNDLKDFCFTNHFGLSDQAGTNEITLREDFKHGSNTGNAAIPTSESMDKGFKKSSIKLKKLDDVWHSDFNHLGKIDLMKIDIEGHEDFCMRGSIEILNSHRPTILMEVNKPYYTSRDVDLDNTFLPLIPENYKIFRRKEQHWLPLASLEECHNLDNIFVVPNEKLNTDSYRIFRQNN